MPEVVFFGVCVSPKLPKNEKKMLQSLKKFLNIIDMILVLQPKIQKKLDITKILFVGAQAIESKMKRHACHYFKRRIIIGCDCTECSPKMYKFNEPLYGVWGNTGTGALVLREQGILSNYFQETRDS